MRPLFTSLLALAFLAGCKSTPQPVPDAPVTAASTEVDESWRASQPQPGDAPEMQLPTFEAASLDNGMRVLISRRTELPLVTLAVSCKAGAALDPKGKAGLADISYRMLLEGAGTRDALAFDDAFADLGVSPGVGVGYGGGLLSATVLTENADAALGLLADALIRPRLDEASFKRRHAQTLANLARLSSVPSHLSAWANAEAIFGADHPYGELTGGTEPSVRNIRRADVQRFLKANLGPRVCAVVAAGDITLEDAKGLAQKHFGRWKGTAQPPLAPEVPELSPRKEVILVEVPDLQQTHVSVGRPGLTHGDPQEAALDLATSVFGGMFGSRLNMNLREDKGYTYGAGAYSSTRLGPGVVGARSAVRADVTGPSVTEFFKELEGIHSRPITEQELAEAREGLLRSTPGDFETIGALAGTASSIFQRDAELDMVATHLAALEAADLAAVQAAADAFLKPELMKLILVGDPETVKSQVGPLNLGTIRSVTLPR